MREATVCAEGITIGYPKNKKEDRIALHKDLSFTLYAGELTCLLGANGAGKSTLLRTLTGIQPELSGDIILRGKRLQKYSEQELSRLLGLVLTDKSMIGGLTAYELVSLGRYPYTGFFGRLSSKDDQVIKTAMANVKILDKANSYMSELSDGEFQKVMIAKALAQECPIIILDEPTAFLDVVNRFEIMNLLHNLAVNQNKTILLSTHDIEQALLLADRLWLLSKNKGLITGTTEDIVLGNYINQYITNDVINFDLNSGRFTIKEECGIPVYLEGENNLYHWASNFLSRKGYYLSSNPNVDIKVQIFSPQHICVTYRTDEFILKSFESFDIWLSQNLDKR